MGTDVSAAGVYRARVEAVLAQRTRLRGPQPSEDLFAGLPTESPLLVAEPRRALEPNVEILASYLRADDVVVDVGGGAGRISLPLALRCREVVNVDPSAAMLAAFRANAARAGIANVRAVLAGWPTAEAPRGSVALVNHVTYLTREIVPFLEALAAAASRRVLLTVNDPPPPSRHRVLYELVYGEPEATVPGHAELVAVLEEMGIAPEVRRLPDPVRGLAPAPAPSREAAVRTATTALMAAQWAYWPLDEELAARARAVVESRFGELFEETAGGYRQRWVSPGHEVLITWETRRG